MDFKATAPQPGMQDLAIINWIGSFGGLWITTDEAAKRAYAPALLQAGVHVLEIHRPKAGMGLRDQVRLLVSVVQKVVQQVQASRRPQVFRARYSGERPVLERRVTGDTKVGWVGV